MNSNLRNKLKSSPVILETYFSLILIKNKLIHYFYISYLFVSDHASYSHLKRLKNKAISVHPTKANLTNSTQSYLGKNIINLPALAYIEKDKAFIGWAGKMLNRNEFSLPFLQVTTDIDKNIPLIFETFKPAYIVDFGTASGGSSIFFHELASKYCAPKILTVDINSRDFDAQSAFHNAYGTKDIITTQFNKSSLDCKDEVNAFLSDRKPNEMVMLSFDDDHSYEHTYKELITYAPMLKSGDIILMQDTWDQSLYGHETSPMLAIERFLEEHKTDFDLASDFLRKLELPCNFIYGVIVKR